MLEWFNSLDITTERLVSLAVCVLALILLIALICVCAKKKKVTTKSDNVKIVKGVRFTTNGNEINDDGSVSITHSKGDVLLERGITYTACVGGAIMPGKYTVLSTNENIKRFNIRLGDYVREFSHATDLVIKNGEKICAVSQSVILR